MWGIEGRLELQRDMNVANGKTSSVALMLCDKQIVRGCN
jgi:hypothetical protein